MGPRLPGTWPATVKRQAVPFGKSTEWDLTLPGRAQAPFVSGDPIQVINAIPKADQRELAAVTPTVGKSFLQAGILKLTDTGITNE